MSKTSGPWRWADWSPTFGSWEDVRDLRVLEYNPSHPGEPAPVQRLREDGPRCVLRLEEPIENWYDAELIRRAPELADALNEMLSMFGGNMDSEDYARFRELANPSPFDDTSPDPQQAKGKP